VAGEDAASYHLVVVACHIAALVRRVAAADPAADILRTVHHIVVAAADDERRADDKGLDIAAAAAAAADRVDVVVGSAPADTHPHPCLHHQTNHLFPFSKQKQQVGSEKNRIPGEKKIIEYDSTSIFVFTHVLQHMDDWDPYQ